MGSVAVVVPEALLSASDNSVFVGSLLSSSFGSTVLQQAFNFGSFNVYLFIRPIISPAVIGTSESVICGGT